jgi:hypothetical protein
LVITSKGEADMGSLLDKMAHGPQNPKLLCQHCGEKGHVHTKSVRTKAGVSGGKATAALLTGGISLFAVGLSRKQSLTEAWCGNCSSTWHF